MRVRLSLSSTVVTLRLSMFGGCKSVGRSIHRVIPSSKHRHTQTWHKASKLYAHALFPGLSSAKDKFQTVQNVIRELLCHVTMVTSRHHSLCPQSHCCTTQISWPTNNMQKVGQSLGKVWYDQAYLLVLERLDTVVSQLHRIAE